MQFRKETSLHCTILVGGGYEEWAAGYFREFPGSTDCGISQVCVNSIIFMMLRCSGILMSRSTIENKRTMSLIQKSTVYHNGIKK